MIRHPLSNKLQTAVREALVDDEWDLLLSVSKKVQAFLDRLAEKKAQSIQSRKKGLKKIPVEIDELMRLRDEGLSFSKIAEKLNCSQSLIYKTWKIHVETKKRQ